jgi:Domain of unknown function (DUF1818).
LKINPLPITHYPLPITHYPKNVDRILKTGTGWRLGWNPQATEFQGLVGGDTWAMELTQAEFDDFLSVVG